MSACVPTKCVCTVSICVYVCDVCTVCVYVCDVCTVCVYVCVVCMCVCLLVLYCMCSYRYFNNELLYCTGTVIRYTVDYIIEYCTVSNEIVLIKNIHITLLNLTRYVGIPKLQ